MGNTKQPYIKSQNRKWLIGYLLLQMIIFSLFAGLIDPTFSNANALLAKLRDPQGFLPLIAVTFSIVLEGFLNNPIKEFLVFWRIKNRLPGHRAFSVIGPSDARVNMEKVKALFPKGFPLDPREQNREWFQLYKTFGHEPRVFYSHKAFLLTRDLTALTAVIVPLSLIAHRIMGTPWEAIGYHVLFLLALLVVVSLSARNYGNRFVANVLIEAER